MSLGDGFADLISGGSKRKRFHTSRLGTHPETVSGSFRVVLLQLGVVAIFLLLLAHLFRSQVLLGSYYRELSDNNRARKVVLHAPRGLIYDRNGIALVKNLPAFRLVDCQDDKCQARIISKDQLIDLESNEASISDRLEIDSSRFYVNGEATAHLLGYVSEITAEELAVKKNYLVGDRLGRAGIEQQFESQLKGQDGVEYIEVDALGSQQRILSTSEPKPGKNITLALDWNLQRVAYDALKNRKGVVIVTNPNNGEILALVSGPTYNPNIFTDLAISPAERDRQLTTIFNDEAMPLFDRAISGTYPPGSTYKIVSSTAGLESGKITVDTTVEDTGILVIGPYKFPNWKYLKDGGTQGTLNVVSAMQKSNDIYFYRLGEWTGMEAMEEWSGKMGIGRKLGVELPGEATGSFPGQQWQKDNNVAWYLGNTYHVAIGQGDLLVTPMHVNAWTNIIANGGKLCQPQVLLGKAANCTNVGIQAKNLDLVKQGMIAACTTGGTAYPLFNFSAKSLSTGEKRTINLACKTGTAEFGDPKNHTHAWLTAYAPVEKPEISVTVLVEGAGEGSDIAAPVVKEILESYFEK